MLLLVGLGNPGTGYARNRHNIGFMAADEIVRRHSFSTYRRKFEGQIAEGKLAAEKVIVVKPNTFMNESGRSVGAAVSFYKLMPENVIVFHDEIDLIAGKIRVKRGGDHAGHNGLRSIHYHIGEDYARVRFGVGHPGHKDRVAGHVLKDFAKSDQDWLGKVLDGAAENIELLIRGDDNEFMNRVALNVKPPTKNEVQDHTPPVIQRDSERDAD